MRIKILTVIFLLISQMLVWAGPPTVKRLDGSTISSQEIDATVTRLMKAAEVTGVGITIFHKGKIAFMQTYGLRDTEKLLPLTPDSVLNGASFTKSAFTYLVMQLVDDHTLDLDKPVQEYLPQPLPDYPKYQDLANDPRYKRITARMLLSHTAGFPNFRRLTEDKKLNINFEPGSRYAYSGEGMQLLQFVVETITQKSLKDLMQERVFTPFGMSRSSMITEDRFEDDYANGYDEQGQSLGHQHRKRPDAAGSLQTTLRDFTKFMQAVIEGKRLTKATRERMLSPQIRITSKRQFPTLENTSSDENAAIRLSYGLGWGLYWSPYGKAFFKEGHEDGYRNYTVVFDKPKDGIILMTNSSNGEGIFKELLETLLRNTFTPITWEDYIPYDQLSPRK